MVDIKKTIKEIVYEKLDRGHYYDEIHKNGIRNISYTIEKDNVNITINYSIDVADWFKDMQIRHTCKVSDLLKYERNKKLKVLLD